MKPLALLLKERVIDYKDVNLLLRFISESQKIVPGRVSGISSIQQRHIALAIKRARILALMPYTVM